MSDGGFPVPKVTRVEYLTYASNGERLVRVTSDTIASLIKNYAVNAKSWVLRTNIELTAGMKEFWTPHGRVRVESIVSERKCFELREGDKNEE